MSQFGLPPFIPSDPVWSRLIQCDPVWSGLSPGHGLASGTPSSLHQYPTQRQGQTTTHHRGAVPWGSYNRWENWISAATRSVPDNYKRHPHYHDPTLPPPLLLPDDQRPSLRTHSVLTPPPFSLCGGAPISSHGRVESEWCVFRGACRRWRLPGGQVTCSAVQQQPSQAVKWGWRLSDARSEELPRLLTGHSDQSGARQPCNVG